MSKFRGQSSPALRSCCDIVSYNEKPTRRPERQCAGYLVSAASRQSQCGAEGQGPAIPLLSEKMKKLCKEHPQHEPLAYREGPQPRADGNVGLTHGAAPARLPAGHLSDGPATGIDSALARNQAAGPEG